MQYVKEPATHPWPVNPAEYPLSGPTGGPVYVPPSYQTTSHPIRSFIFWMCVGLLASGLGVGILFLVGFGLYLLFK